MDPYVTSTPNSTKLPILDTEFGHSYRAHAQDKSVYDEATPSSRRKGRNVAVTAEDMQNKYETAKELWEAILRTFGRNEATKKTKKNLLKQQYGNFKSLERDLELKDYKIENLTNELEKVKKERDGISSKLGKFVNSSKDLDQMLESHKSGNDKKGVGFDEYRSVPPPPTQVYSSPMPDLSWTGLPEFVDNTVTDYTRPTPSVEKQMMDLDFEDESDTESTPIESIRSTINQNRDQPRGNQRNWNNLKSQQLGKDFCYANKADINVIPLSL
ncbi:hypothetical protein Tco_0343806 [Tanacetum coccineum]